MTQLKLFSGREEVDALVSALSLGWGLVLPEFIISKVINWLLIDHFTLNVVKDCSLQSVNQSISHPWSPSALWPCPSTPSVVCHLVFQLRAVEHSEDPTCTARWECDCLCSFLFLALSSSLTKHTFLFPAITNQLFFFQLNYNLHLTINCVYLYLKIIWNGTFNYYRS